MERLSNTPPQIDVPTLLEVVRTKHRAPWLIPTGHPDEQGFKHEPEIEKQLTITNEELQILEEVIFLCCYPPFVEDVVRVRKEISEKAGLDLGELDSYMGSEVLRDVYAAARVPFWRLMQGLMGKYGLAYSLYWPKNDYFARQDAAKSEYMRELRLGEKKAEAKVLESLLENCDRCSILENIIFFNDPFPPAEPVWFSFDHLRRKSPVHNYSFKSLFDVPYLEVRFPLYATIPEMVEQIKEFFPRIQEDRAKSFPVPIRKDRRKSDLPRMMEAYRLHQQGFGLEAIAERLDETEGKTGAGKGDFRKAASVRRLIERAGQEMALRFKKNK